MSSLIEAIIQVHAGLPSGSWQDAASSPFMRLAGHPTARRVWCEQCLPGRRKPDVLRHGIVGMPGSMVIHPNAAMNDIESSPTPRIPWSELINIPPFPPPLPSPPLPSPQTPKKNFRKRSGREYPRSGTWRGRDRWTGRGGRCEA